jgi:CBS domain-containing protein
MGLMADRNFRHLPVVDHGKVTGVISIGDVGWKQMRSGSMGRTDLGLPRDLHPRLWRRVIAGPRP